MHQLVLKDLETYKEIKILKTDFSYNLSNSMSEKNQSFYGKLIFKCKEKKVGFTSMLFHF